LHLFVPVPTLSIQQTPPGSTLFPYTTLFRSLQEDVWLIKSTLPGAAFVTPTSRYNKPQGLVQLLSLVAVQYYQLKTFQGKRGIPDGPRFTVGCPCRN